MLLRYGEAVLSKSKLAEGTDMPTDASTPPVVATSAILDEPADAAVEHPVPADVQVQPKQGLFVTSRSSAGAPPTLMCGNATPFSYGCASMEEWILLMTHWRQ